MYDGNPIVLSRSILEDAARCKRKFFYKHIQKIDEPRTSQGASEGIIIHAGLAAAYTFYKAYTPHAQRIAWEHVKPEIKKTAMKEMAKMIASGQHEYRGQVLPLSEHTQEQETVERLGDVVQFYIDHQMQHDLDNAEVVAVEQNLVAYLPSLGVIDRDFGGLLEGQIDLILKRTLPDGKVVYQVYDHKTIDADVNKNLDYLRLNVQFMVYEWLANQTLDGPVEMVYNIIRRDRPPGYGTRELRYNKDGSVSKTNASTDPKDYIRQEFMAHTEEELRYVEAEIMSLAYQAIDLTVPRLSPDLLDYSYTRTVIETGGQACTNCPYFTRCAAELLGHGQPNWPAKI
jgi:hypothetical protein